MTSTMNNKVEIPAAQTRILDAAISCVKRWGIQRVTLNDIADEAGFARSTVYSYYSNRDEVIRAGLLQSAYAFGEKLLNHISQIKAPRDRLIEAVAYSVEVLPSEPYLALMSDSTLSEILNAEALTDPQSTDIGLALFQVIMQRENRSDDETLEIVEFAFRFLLSLLTMKSPVERTKDELRGFIARRMLPSIGLTVPSKYKLVKSRK